MEIVCGVGIRKHRSQIAACLLHDITGLTRSNYETKQDGPFYRVTPRSYGEAQGNNRRNSGANGQSSNPTANAGGNREAGIAIQGLQQGGALAFQRRVVPPPTQSRMNMTGAQRSASYPPSQFDVPVKDQIVRYGDDVGGAMMHRPKTTVPNTRSNYEIKQDGPFYRVTPRSYREAQGNAGGNNAAIGQPSNSPTNTGADREAGRGIQPLQQKLSGGQKVVPTPMQMGAVATFGIKCAQNVSEQ